MNIKDLDRLLFPYWQGDIMEKETVFAVKGQLSPLLYRAEKLLSVQSLDLSMTYEEGRDYLLKDGCLLLPETTRIHCMEEEQYYSQNPAATHITLRTMRNGEPTVTWWGEGRSMSDWQISVNYTHRDSWDGFLPRGQKEKIKPFLDRMEKGKDVTILFYGDSITTGANSTDFIGAEPHFPSWPMMVTLSLAKRYGYTVRFAETGLPNCTRVPEETIAFGDRGTVTYLNTAVGGWSVQTGLDRADEYVLPFIKEYGCDLFILAFGMNDGQNPPETEKKLTAGILDKLCAVTPEATLLLLATMLPNPEAIGWTKHQPEFEPMLEELAESYPHAATVPMTSYSKALLSRKPFRDMTGNNINHPNDFMARAYAQLVLDTLMGTGTTKKA